MDLQIAKWGNSLAVRIPSELVRQLGLREGATIEARLTADGALSLRPAHANWDRKAFAAELREASESMPMGESVVEEMRRGARY